MSSVECIETQTSTYQKDPQKSKSKSYDIVLEWIDVEIDDREDERSDEDFAERSDVI